MGCMTTLILASEYPDLYAAYMFVDGQWDISMWQGFKHRPSSTLRLRISILSLGQQVRSDGVVVRRLQQA